MKQRTGSIQPGRGIQCMWIMRMCFTRYRRTITATPSFSCTAPGSPVWDPLYSSDYRFRKVYILSTATEDESYVSEKAVSGLQGWVDCFEKAELAGALFCGGISNPGEASGKKDEQDEAYEFGKSLE